MDFFLAVRSFALTCLLVSTAAYCLQLVNGGSISTCLKFVAIVYGIGLVGAHMLAMVCAKLFSAPSGLTPAAKDSCSMRTNPARTDPIEDTGYYEYYHGHEVTDLRFVLQRLRELGCESSIFLCGDSSLDNKHWFFKKAEESTSNKANAGKILEYEMKNNDITAPAVNGYESVLVPASARRGARMAKDVCYWLNYHAPGNGKVCTIMSSVEASTAADRVDVTRKQTVKLLKQDAFIRDNLTANDFVLMSVGGNDIAMAPTIATMVNIGLLCYSPYWLIWLGLAPGYAHLVRWLGTMIVEYVAE